MSNTGEHFADALLPNAVSPRDKNRSSSSSSSSPASPGGTDNNNGQQSNTPRMDGKLVEKQEAFIKRLNECQAEDEGGQQEEAGILRPLPALAEESETSDSGSSRVDHMSIAENENNLNKNCEQLNQLDVSPIRFIDENAEPSGPVNSSSTPEGPGRMDGVVLTCGDENEFLNPNNISPILKINRASDESLKKITEEEEDDEDDIDDYIIANKDALKRRRQEDSFDDISMISTDSFATSVVYGSAKKPKLIRTGSITRGLRRSMSFAAIKTPIASMLRSRRNSVDPNASISSIASIETTFNESIKKPVKEKLRSIRDKITKSSKKETPKSIKNKGLITSANLDSLKNVCKFKTDKNVVNTPEHSKNSDKVEADFKTPIAPPYPSSSSSSKAKKKTIFHRHSMIATASSNSLALLDVQPPVPIGLPEESKDDELATALPIAIKIDSSETVTAIETVGQDLETTSAASAPPGTTTVSMSFHYVFILLTSITPHLEALDSVL